MESPSSFHFNKDIVIAMPKKKGNGAKMALYYPKKIFAKMHYTNRVE